MKYLYGLAKSKLIYEYLPGRLRGMTLFYGSFVGSGDLCFDIGSHLGNRASVLAGLGCMVVAVEPHPYLAGYLKKKFSNNDRVIVEDVGLSDRDGEAQLYCSPGNLTVSSLNSDWMESLQSLRPHDIRFTEQYKIKTITINELIRHHGLPKYCKIDIEGRDVAVLKTLRHAIPIISFEHLPHLYEETVEAIDILLGLGAYRFNFFPRETHRFKFKRPVGERELLRALREISTRKRSCDVYAFRQVSVSPPPTES